MKRMVVPVAVLLAALAGGAPAQEKPQETPAPKTPDKPAEPPLVVDAQDKPVAFPAQVEQVIVDLVVADKKGVPAPLLGKDDFIISEDGVPQSVVSFEAVQVPAAPSAEPKPRPRVSTNLAKEDRTGRVFVVVFDDINLTPMMSQRAKGAVAEFLKNGTREGDRVLLVATSGAVWWSARLEQGREELLALLKRLDGRYIPDLSPERMTDYEAMRIHMFNDPQVADRVSRRYEKFGVSQQAQSQQSTTGGSDLSGYDNPMVTGRATEVYFQSVTRNRLTLDLIERVMGALGDTRGRKSLILVSQGFIYDPNLDEFKRVVQASRRANAAIYFLDTRGLEGMPVYMTAQFGPALDERDIGFAFSENVEASEGSESIADDSGGFTVRNTNDLNKGITRIADDSRMYYMIGYNPTNTARDGKFRKIQVKLTPAADRKGLQIRARKGYYAPSDGKTALSPKSSGNTDPALQAAVDSPFDRDELPLRMTAYVFDETLLGKSQTLVAADIDIRNLSFEEKDGRSYDTLEFMMVVAHRETGEFFRYDQKMDLKLLPATRKKFEQSWVPVVRDFELKPGLYQAKVVVRDKNAKKIGTLTHEFEVPDPAQFRISSPILSDTLQPAKEGEPATKRPVPAMLARRTFPGGDGMIYCSIDVYGAQKDAKTGMPQVAMGYVVKRASDGSTVTRIDPTPIKPTTLGKLSRLVGVGLQQFEPGDYDFVLQVSDQVSGKSLEQKEPFTVGPPPGGAGRSRDSGSGARDGRPDRPANSLSQKR